tara:strand:+ start:1688 stop:2140 length:453 start_codon:yes stop_codon:yes gene_type:complete
MKTTKQKFFAELNKRRPSKINLSLMSDLSSAVEEMRSYNLEAQYETAKSQYVDALGLLNTLEGVVDRYASSFDKLSMDSDFQLEAYEKARDIYFEITNQLQDLGVDESPEISNLGNEIAEGEQARVRAADQISTEFDEHDSLIENILRGQ